jgi:hypothetical protein
MNAFMLSGFFFLAIVSGLGYLFSASIFVGNFVSGKKDEISSGDVIVMFVLLFIFASCSSILFFNFINN